jgi:hypothetical protein
MSRRRVSDADLARWFDFEPVAHPVAAPEWQVAASARTA